MMTEICIHGAFRSGTNFARALLELNYECRTYFDKFGWKHDLYPIITKSSDLSYPKVPSLLVTKGPFSLISSLFNYAHATDHNITSSAKEGLSIFLRTPFIIHDGKRGDVPELYFDDPVSYFNAYHWNLLSAVQRKENGFHWRYEDLMTNPEQIVLPLAEHLGLTRVTEAFEIPVNKMKKLGDRSHDTSQFTTTDQFDRNKVQPSTFMAAFSHDDVEYIRGRLSRDLIDRLGYQDDTFTVI